jgi:hypothetical protein
VPQIIDQELVGIIVPLRKGISVGIIESRSSVQPSVHASWTLETCRTLSPKMSRLSGPPSFTAYRSKMCMYMSRAILCCGSEFAGKRYGV